MVDMRSEHAFLGVEGLHPKSKSLRTRNLTDEERRRGANKEEEEPTKRGPLRWYPRIRNQADLDKCR